MKINTYKVMAVVIIICIIATLIFSYKTTTKITKKEGYIELYFENQKDLPGKIIISESENISVVINNKELYPINYFLEVESSINNYAKNISIGPQTRIDINLIINATGKDWELLIVKLEKSNFKLNKIENAEIMNKESEYFIIDNIHYKNTELMSHNISLFGDIYHTNLSLEELKENPFRKYYEYKNNEVNEASSYKEETLLYINNNELHINYSIEEEIYQYWEEPFIVKLYNPEGSKESIKNVYFWYEII